MNEMKAIFSFCMFDFQIKSQYMYVVLFFLSILLHYQNIVTKSIIDAILVLQHYNGQVTDVYTLSNLVESLYAEPWLSFFFSINK